MLNRVTKNQFRLCCLFLSVLGFLFILITTFKGGIGLTPDSVHFIAGSRGILEGRGFMRYYDTPTASWPPLYPLLISGLTLMIRGSGLDILEGLRFVQALVYGLTIFATGGLFLRYIPSRLYALLGLVTVLLAKPLLLVSVYVWTEGLFILLSLIFFYYLPGFLEEHKWWQFIILLAVTFMGTMQRFGGVGLIPAGCLCILLFMKNASLLKRFAYATIFGFGIIPTAIWILYAFTLPSVWGQSSADPAGALAVNLQRTISVLSEWLVPSSIRTQETSLFVSILVVAMIVGMIFHYYRRRILNGGIPSMHTHPVIFAVYILSFMLFLYIYMITTYNTPLDQRHLSIFYIFVILVIFWYMELLSRRLRNVRWREYALVFGISLWLLHPATIFREEVIFRQEACCQAIVYRDSNVINWLKTHPLAGKIYSNTPIPLIYTLLPVYTMPYEEGRLLANLSRSNTYFIKYKYVSNLIYQASKDFYYDVPYWGEENANIHTQVIVDFDDATIYSLNRLDS